MEDFDMSVAPEWTPPAAPSSEEAPAAGGEGEPQGGSGDQPKDDPKPTEAAKTDGNPPADNADPAKDDKPKDAPATREKSKIDFIMERKARQEARDKAIAEGKTPEEVDDIGVAPEDRDAIRKTIEAEHGEQLAYIAEQRLNNEIESEFQKLKFASQFTPAEKQSFIEHAKSPAYSQVAWENIAVIALGADRLIQMGAQMEKEASAKATATKTGGGSSTAGGEKGLPDFANMTMEEFQAYELSRQR